MANKASLRARQRQSIHSAYRARGHRNNNLWLVYSVKTDRDWLLPSDRQLVHWICTLEANPQVRTFDLAPEQIQSYDARENRATELDSIVYFTDGHIEWHEVKAGEAINNADYRSQLQAQAAAAQQQGMIYRVFSDAELQPQATLAVRWLSALGYAAALRDQLATPTLVAVQSVILARKQGTIAEVLSDLSMHDEMTVMGVLVRIALHNGITLDLSTRSFGRSTRWARYD